MRREYKMMSGHSAPCPKCVMIKTADLPQRSAGHDVKITLEAISAGLLCNKMLIASRIVESALSVKSAF